MKDQSKTNQMLIQEMVSMRQRIAELEQSEAERKEAEEALHLRELQLRTILDSTGDGILAVDNAGRVIKTNSRFADLWKIPSDLLEIGSDEALLTYVLDQLVYPVAFLEKVRALYESSAEDFDTILFKDGRIIERYSSPLLNDGLVNGRVWSFRDVTERVRAEEALRESEERYRYLVQHAPTGIYEIDFATRKFMSVNDAMCQYTGYTREEFMSLDPVQLLTEEGRKAFIQRHAKVIAGEPVPDNVEYKIKRKNGSEFWVILNVHYSYEPNNQIHATAIAHDITDRKEAEEALRESEEKYRSLVSSVDLMYLVDRECRYLFLNEGHRLRFGLRLEEIIGRRYADFHSEEDSMEFAEIVKNVIETGKAIHQERWSERDGRCFLRTFNPSMERGPSGEITEVVIVSKDVTERKRAEEMHRESEKRYRELADFLPISIFEVDTAGSIISFNRTALEAFRYNKEDYKEGMNALQFFPPEEWQRVGENIKQVIQGASIPGQEYTFLRKDSSTFIGLIYASPNIYQDNIVGIIGAIIDVTEQKRAEGERRRLEERLQRAEKMEALGTLAGGVAHDLNNVIGVLMGYSELLLQKVPQENPFQRHAMQIFKGSQRAAAIIQDLLTLTRRGVLVSDVLNMNRIISDFLQTPEFEAIRSHHPGVQFKTSLDAELLNIKGSSTHLSKSVMNLLSNAAEAITGSGEVLIRTENLYVDRRIHGYDTTQEGEYAVLTVSDTGSGISPSDLGRIFEPFYTKKVMGRSGTGLGLAVVWGTVKDHDGYIDVQSTEGEGTIFTLHFPATREALTKFEQAAARDTYIGRGEHVLVVDDVEGQRLLASTMLDSLGYKVSSVSSGEEAVEFVKNNPVDLVILDMIMDPGVDGLDTYRGILDIRPQQKAIIVSGFSETDRVRDAQSLGAGAYIRKPYVIEKLGLAVRKELDRST